MIWFEWCSSWFAFVQQFYLNSEFLVTLRCLLSYWIRFIWLKSVSKSCFEKNIDEGIQGNGIGTKYEALDFISLNLIFLGAVQLLSTRLCMWGCYRSFSHHNYRILLVTIGTRRFNKIQQLIILLMKPCRSLRKCFQKNWFFREATFSDHPRILSTVCTLINSKVLLQLKTRISEKRFLCLYGIEYPKICNLI